MIRISVTTSGNLRLRELAKYIGNDKNFGFVQSDIKAAIKAESKKAFGKPASSTAIAQQPTSLPGEALLRSINSIKNNDKPLKLEQAAGPLLLSAILKDPALSAKYKKSTKSFNISYFSSKGSAVYYEPVRYDNSFLSLQLSNTLRTNVKPQKVNRFLTNLANSTILSKSVLKENEEKVQKISFRVDEQVSEIQITDPVDNKEKFLSGAQLTILVRKRLRQTSVTHPAKNKPNLSFRTGQNFIDTVDVFPNYREKLISYIYNPLMDYNNKYGNNADLQVRNSVREVLQEYYKREFATSNIAVTRG